MGAIGKVWRLDIPFAHVPDAAGYAAFAAPDFVEVAWALRVDATDDEAWDKFRRYLRVIGPASHLVRRTLLATLARKLGTPTAVENERPLPGDELLPDAGAQVTHGIDIDAPPEAVWPWLVQAPRSYPAPGPQRPAGASARATRCGCQRPSIRQSPDAEPEAIGGWRETSGVAQPPADCSAAACRPGRPQQRVAGGGALPATATVGALAVAADHRRRAMAAEATRP